MHTFIYFSQSPFGAITGKRKAYTYTSRDDLESLFWSLLDVLARADVGHRLPWYRHLKKPSSFNDLCDSRYASVYNDIKWNTIMNSQLLYLIVM